MTVRVTTSRICLTLVAPPFFEFSHPLACCCGCPPALVGPAGTSVYRFAFSAASQSNGLLTLRALHGVRTAGLLLLLSTAGEGGTRRLGKVVGPVAGAESG